MTHFVAEALEDLTLGGVLVKRGDLMEVQGLSVRILDRGHGPRSTGPANVDAPDLPKVDIRLNGK